MGFEFVCASFTICIRLLDRSRWRVPCVAARAKLFCILLYFFFSPLFRLPHTNKLSYLLWLTWHDLFAFHWLSQKKKKKYTHLWSHSILSNRVLYTNSMRWLSAWPIQCFMMSINVSSTIWNVYICARRETQKKLFLSLNIFSMFGRCCAC